MILSPIEQSIKQKIETVGTPLKDWDIQINYGIKTGFNDAFIVSTEKRDEILANCSNEDERKRTDALIRPILRGRDIKRYGYEWAGLYLIATFPARHYDIDKYPAVKQYLLSFAYEYLIENGNKWVAENHLADFCKQKLDQTGQYVVINGKYITDDKGNKEKGRKKTSNKWFETQDSISYWEVFCRPIIPWQRITAANQFCITSPGTLVLDSMAFISNTKGEEYLLLAVLNSRLVYFWIKKNVHEYGSTGFRLSNQYVEQIPIPMVNEHLHMQAKLLVESLLNNEDQETEDRINMFVYNLYGLTSKEIDVIESVQTQL